MGAQHAHTAGWSACFSEAAPGAILAAVLGAVLVALVGLIAWIAVSVVDLQTQAGKLETRVEEGFERTDERLTRLEKRVEEGFEKTDERLTRLEDRVVDIYKLLSERLPPPQEKSSRQR